MKTRNRRGFLFWASVLAQANVAVVLGQIPTGSLGGVVLDESAAAIQASKVTVVNTETGLRRSVLTEGDGSFVVAALPAGNYEIRADAKGFRTLVQTAIVRTEST